MSTKRLGRVQRAATIVPLAVLSAAWTASVAGIGGVTSPVSAENTPDGSLPDGTTVPTEAIEAPASVSDPGDNTNDQQIVSASSTNAIPSAALAAYQRAETVINAADKSCNLTWQLVAAIGRVESNHGRFGGNVLDDDGVARPGIYGVALNGKNGTRAISDTDAGQIDNDTKWDRAVGPMQFIPSTWSVVGVDADNDAQRNPQDIDDAALATAVYLCSGDDDLSTLAGQRAAVFRYNHSQRYVDLVLEIMEAYLEGDFSTVPNNTTAAGYIVPDVPPYNPGSNNFSNGGGSDNFSGPGTSSNDGGGGSEPAPNPSPSPNPSPTPTPTPTAPPAGGGNTDPKGDNVPNTGNNNVDDTAEGAGDAVLTLAEAIDKCILKGVVDNPLTAVNELDQCAANLLK